MTRNKKNKTILNDSLGKRKSLLMGGNLKSLSFSSISCQEIKWIWTAPGIKTKDKFYTHIAFSRLILPFNDIVITCK